jgi:hypothetical protein
MSPVILFQTHLVLGYVAWLLCFGTYIFRHREKQRWQDGLDLRLVRSATAQAGQIAKSCFTPHQHYQR